MKNYRLLNDGETILETDLCYNFGRKWDTPQDTIGMPFNSKLIFPIKREVPQPQWQTGEIPEPTGLCIAILEMRNGNYHFARPYKSGVTKKYTWPSVYGLSIERVATHLKEEFTGRWFIQSINLPS